MGKIRKLKFPKIVNKSLKIKEFTSNYIKWEKSENQNFLKSLKSHCNQKIVYNRKRSENRIFL